MASEISNQTRTIKLNVEQASNMDFLVSDGEHEVEIAPNSVSSTLELVTLDDELYEDFGTITVTVLLNPDSVYQIADSPGNIATMNIEDNDDTPMISITGGDPVLESGIAEFTLSTTHLASSDLVINISLSQGDSDFIDQSTTTYPNSHPFYFQQVQARLDLKYCTH